MAYDEIRVNATARGRVQGVGYRVSVHSGISRLNVRGYVRNMPDGTVFLDIQGTKADVAEALKIAEEGSPFSEVERLDIEEVALGDLYEGFFIQR